MLCCAALLQEAWAALDTSGAGFLTAGQFGQFMRLGDTGPAGPSWRERAQTARPHSIA
jgi:hypothetical protein